jgi:hypothetical protein
MVFVLSCEARAVVLVSNPQTPRDQRDFLLGRGNPSLRLLLKSMKHIDHSREAHGVNGPVGVTVEVFDDLQHTASAESLERLRRDGLAAELRLS